MLKLSCGLALALAFAPVSVSAQTTPAVVAAPTNGMAMLRTGTEVPLRLSEELTTLGKQLRVGQRFHLEVASPVLVQGVTVIPAGSPAIGEITEVRNKGMWGKSGHLGARILYVTVNGRQIRLSGAFDDKGVTGTGGVVAAIAFIPVAGFFTTGTSAKVPSGAAVKGFVDEDIPLTIASTAGAPMVVGGPAVSTTVAMDSASPAAATPATTAPTAVAAPATAPAVLIKTSATKG